MNGKPSFLITIDTEGDDLWSRPQTATTKNAFYLPRFQELCEKYGFKPTYLTNYEMVNSEAFQELGKDIIKRNAGEVGMHLHAWDMPPAFELTKDDSRFHPYLIEYPETVMREKIKIMTDRLEEVFGIKMLSHRAGRWAFDERYAQLLLEFGYTVDCSVTPYLSWAEQIGDPDKNGGADYTGFPEKAYFVDPADISRSGNSSLLEVPVTISYPFAKVRNFLSDSFVAENFIVRKVVNHLKPTFGLRPNGQNLKDMLSCIKRSSVSGKDYVEFMLHSSELMPGCSPKFRTEASIDNLYVNMEALFEKVALHFEGCTLSEYRDKFVDNRR